MVLIAIAVQVGWAVVMAASLTDTPLSPIVVFAADAARPLVWTALLLAMLWASGRDEPLPRLQTPVGPWIGEPPDRRPDRSATAWSRTAARRNLAMLVGIAVAGALALAQIAAALTDAAPAVRYGGAMLAACFGLVCCEQVLRNTLDASRWAVKFLCLAVAAAFAFDLVLNGDALVRGRIDYSWWAARGYGHALLAPLVAVAAARMPDWRLDLRLSRKVVFHATTLVASALILVAIGAIGYGVRLFGDAWGAVAQALVVFVSMVALAALVASSSLRARLRVTLVKHLFSYRYEYRTEWLKLTDLLAHSSRHEGTLAQRALQGVGDLVESPAGALWLRSDEGDWRCAATRRLEPRPPVRGDDPLPRWLAQRQWIIELAEWRAHPERYDELAIPGWLTDDEDAWLVVPLVLHDQLVGFVQLQTAVVSVPLDWEVRDVLKTAGRQVAGYLAVQQAVERLVQARQFESFNRMSAFVVHDLKNLVAQLTLLLRNADRHRDNPEFQADMLETVENVLDRMQGLLLQLRVGTRPVEQPAPVPLGAVLRAAVAGKKGLRLEPSLSMDDDVERTPVIAHRDRLERVVGHLIQNAIEATPPGGTVAVAAHQDGRDAIVTVTDTGRGMSAAFIESRLFKPFMSTKEHGMGIGAFESREYVREIGGRLDVESAEGRGTTFTLRLPIHGEQPCAPRES
jgi:putative PEP-CTERM system histidine kinase